MELVDLLYENRIKERELSDQLRADNQLIHTTILGKEQAPLKSDIQNVTADIDRYRDKYKSVKAASDKAVKELMGMKTSLYKSEDFAQQLCKKLKSQTGMLTNSVDSKPSLLVIVDRYTVGLISQLSLSDRKWEKFVVRKGVNNLQIMLKDDEHRKRTYEHDQVLTLLGPNDIRAGNDGLSVSMQLCSLAPSLQEELLMDVLVCQLPLAGDYTFEIKCFNRQLDQIGKSVVMIDTEKDFDMLSDNQLIKTDGSFYDITGDILSTTIIHHVSELGTYKPKPNYTSLCMAKKA